MKKKLIIGIITGCIVIFLVYAWIVQPMILKDVVKVEEMIFESDEIPRLYATPKEVYCHIDKIVMLLTKVASLVSAILGIMIVKKKIK